VNFKISQELSKHSCYIWKQFFVITSIELYAADRENRKCQGNLPSCCCCWPWARRNGVYCKDHLSLCTKQVLDRILAPLTFPMRHIAQSTSLHPIHVSSVVFALSDLSLRSVGYYQNIRAVNSQYQLWVRNLFFCFFPRPWLWDVRHVKMFYSSNKEM
jgi:hypothetical protein